MQIEIKISRYRSIFLIAATCFSVLCSGMYKPNLDLYMRCTPHTSHFYLPYRWHLWDLAPAVGQGVSVVVVDNGVIMHESDDATLLSSCSVQVPPVCCNAVDYPATLRALTHIANCIGKYCTNSSVSFEHAAAGIVREYLVEKKNYVLLQLLEQHATADIFLAGSLTARGAAAVRNIQFLVQKYYEQGYFTPVVVRSPWWGEDQLHILEFLALNKKQYPAYGHGTHLVQLIADCVPQATICMIKGCADAGTSSLDHIVYALQAAESLGADIVNLSLLYEGVGDEQILYTVQTLAQKYAYVCIAAGNTQLHEYIPTSMLVGASNAQQKVAYFCQELVAQVYAPGYKLMYNGDCLSGTSYATALVTASVALVHSAWKHFFTPGHVHDVLRRTRVRGPDGRCCMFDLQTALFVLQLVYQVCRLLPVFCPALVVKSNPYELLDRIFSCVFSEVSLVSCSCLWVSYCFSDEKVTYSLSVFCLAWVAALLMSCDEVGN